MIEIFDSSCSRSLGQSASIRAAIDILNAPSAAGRPGMTPIGALFPNKNIPLSATTGSGICKEPAKSRFAIPCRITSAVKRSGICQQTIGCRRFVRNLRFLRQPKDVRPRSVRPGLLPHNRQELPALRIRICRDAIHRRKGHLRNLRSNTTCCSKHPGRYGLVFRHRTDCRNAHPQSSPIHPGVRMPRQRRRMPRLPGLPAYSRPDCPKRHSRPAGAYEL